MNQIKEPKHARQLQRLAQGVLFATTFCILVGAGGCPGGGLAPAAPPPAGPFAFTASTYSVNIPQNTLSTDIEFRVTSDGTFTGNVVVHWQATGDCTPSPDTNDITLSVSPGSPGTFKRKMYRWSATGRNLKWTATHAASNTSRSLDIAFTH